MVEPTEFTYKKIYVKIPTITNSLSIAIANCPYCDKELKFSEIFLRQLENIKQPIICLHCKKKIEVVVI